jgi:hypothetical protein
MSGWIKLHRSITNHWLYTEKRVFSKFEAWNDILLTVNFTDAKTIIKGSLYEVKRGQSILSLESWSKRWNWNRSKVSRFLNTLQLDGMIVVKSDTVTTQLTVCNYESYQGERTADETQTRRRRDADETQVNTIEEGKKEKKEISIFIEPTYNEILEYCTQRKNGIDVNKFLNFYASKGWMVGKNKMKDWKACVRSWEKPIEIPEVNEPKKWKAPWS